MAGVGRCVMTTLYAARRPANNLGAPYDIIRCQHDGTDLEVVAAPPKGRSFTRPIVAPNGRLAWWDIGRGGSHDNPISMRDAYWWIDGVRMQRPKNWYACGHLEWHPDGRTLVAAVWPYWWWFFPAKDFQPFVSLGGGSWVEDSRSGIGDYDPSVAPDGRLVVATKRPELGRGVRIIGGGQRDVFLPVPGGDVFDPFVSPNGRRVVVLVLESLSRHRIDVIDIDSGQRTTVIPSADRTACSAARWIDNDTLMVCRLLPDDALTWRPWIIGVSTGQRTPCWSTKTAQQIGSVEYAFPIA